MSKFTPIKETVLLLGGTGFIGRNIIDYVCKNDELLIKYKFIILSRDFEIDKIDSFEYVSGDFTDKNVLIQLFSEYDFTRVFHCATSTTPISSDNNILNDINGNLIATIGLLDVMNDFNCKSIIYLSSGGAVYGEKSLKKISENEICYPLSSYGVVKLTIENYLRLYQKKFGINYLILRVSNPFGRFHVSEKQGVVNIAIRRVLRKEILEVWGDGSQTKDYIFADDLVKIIFQLLINNISNKIINLGSGKTFQLNNILDTIKIYLPNLKVNFVASKTTDVRNFCLDISLLKSLVDFQLTEFEEAIKKTISWEKDKLEK